MCARQPRCRRSTPSDVVSWVSGVRLHDFGCSLKAYRREVMDGVRLYGEMHRFLPIYAKWHGAKIAEVVVRHYARQHGRSQFFRLGRVARSLLDVALLWVNLVLLRRRDA